MQCQDILILKKYCKSFYGEKCLKFSQCHIEPFLNAKGFLLGLQDEAYDIYILDGRDIKIFEVIRIPSLEQEDLETLNRIFEGYLKQKLKNRKKTTRIYFIFFFCAEEETRAYRDIMIRAVIPGIRRYRLPTGITLNDGRIQMPDYDVSYGTVSYRKMKDEFFSILQSTASN